MFKHFFLLFLITACAQTPSKRSDKLSILQGVTSAKEVEFSVVAQKGRELKFELRNAEDEVIAPDEAKLVSRDHSGIVVHKLIFSRDQTKDYNIYVYEGDRLVDQRLIGRGALDPDNLKLAAASCSNDYHDSELKIWNEVVKNGPEYLLLIGDNVYVDKKSSGKSMSVTPEIMWERYADVRLRLPIFFEQKLIPTHAVWDDHDFGSKEVFDAFYAQSLAEDAWTPGPGVSGLLSIGDFNLYFLDGRSFRAKSSDGKQLGIDQENWLLSKLKEQPGPSFIIKGDQFFGGYHGGDSFEGSHPKDFTLFAGELARIDTPFIFLSGDRHMSEIMQFPRGLFKKPSFEITSSPIHNDMTPTPDAVNPWRVVANKTHPNFVLIKNTAKDNHWFLDVESIGINGEVHFQRELAVYIKDLQDNLQEVRKKRRSGQRRYRRIRRSRR